MNSKPQKHRDGTVKYKVTTRAQARRTEFLEFATAVPFPTTVLACSTMTSVIRSDASMRAAQVLVGVVDAERVPRLAERLDELIRLDKAHGAKASKHGR